MRASPTGPYPSKARPIGVEPLVAAGAGLIGPVAGQGLAEGQLAELGLVVGQVGDVRRRRGDVLAQEPPDDPVAALDGAGAQAGRVLGQEHRHRQQPAAAVAGRVVDPHPGVGAARGDGHAVVAGERGG